MLARAISGNARGDGDVAHRLFAVVAPDAALRERAAQPLRHHACAGERRLRQQQRELFSAVARRDAMSLDRALDELTDAADDRIAEQVAEGVVDLLEVV